MSEERSDGVIVYWHSDEGVEAHMSAMGFPSIAERFYEAERRRLLQSFFTEGKVKTRFSP